MSGLILRKMIKIPLKNNCKDYFWNIIAGSINAIEAVVMSAIVVRTNGLAQAGMVNIAFAIGNTLLTVGKFGVRNFQVTDVTGKYSFLTYVKTRVLTSFIMLILLFSYLLYAFTYLNYNADKIIIMFSIGGIYVVESIEDVLWGHYQLCNKLYIGAKMFCLRWLGIFFTFIIGLYITKKVEIALFISMLISVVLFSLLTLFTYPQISNEKHPLKKFPHEKKAIKNLINDTFPLFVCLFLSFYLNNSPKYAIDICMNDESQAYYNFISMPIFVIGLLSNFIYQPTIVEMAKEYSMKNKKKFTQRIITQIVLLAIITLLCLFFTNILGIPLLSWLFYTNLSIYEKEILILMASGGFLALNGYLNIILTSMRFQKELIWPYGLVSILSILCMRKFVKKYGILGAAWTYFFLMFFLFIISTKLVIIKIKQIS